VTPTFVPPQSAVSHLINYSADMFRIHFGLVIVDIPSPQEGIFRTLGWHEREISDGLTIN
jgi:hypothetical protein